MIPRKAAGLCGVLAPPLAFALIFLAIHLNGSWFSWTDNALSDLGSAKSASPLVFDAGLIGASLLGLVVAAKLRESVRGRLGRAGVWVLAVGVLSMGGIGAFASPSLPHLAFSVAFFTITPLGLLFLGLDARGAERRWALLSLALALAAWVVWTLPYPGKGVAIPEALSAGLMSAWSITFGARLLLTPEGSGGSVSQKG